MFVIAGLGLDNLVLVALGLVHGLPIVSLILGGLSLLDSAADHLRVVTGFFDFFHNHLVTGFGHGHDLLTIPGLNHRNFAIRSFWGIGFWELLMEVLIPWSVVSMVWRRFFLWSLWLLWSLWPSWSSKMSLEVWLVRLRDVVLGEIDGQERMLGSHSMNHIFGVKRWMSVILG